jgi:hypothetical protein
MISFDKKSFSLAGIISFDRNLFIFTETLSLGHGTIYVTENNFFQQVNIPFEKKYFPTTGNHFI